MPASAVILTSIEKIRVDVIKKFVVDEGIGGWRWRARESVFMASGRGGEGVEAVHGALSERGVCRCSDHF